ncbi:uncharacterized protein ARMOST_12556 [Armillaria ostoyae]|uniref:Uncharacterized protein n=1 Tax=Armillaria ostoyae TaxID=47428 RepID=A0A284RKA3_ARMOS|nr:uncharacterized protein ARMOST_12556 [Armillaria ostoyae]
MSEVFIDWTGIKNALGEPSLPTAAIYNAFRWGQLTRFQSSSKLQAERLRAMKNPAQYLPGLYLGDAKNDEALKGFFLYHDFTEERNTGIISIDDSVTLAVADPDRVDDQVSSKVLLVRNPATGPAQSQPISSMMAVQTSSRLTRPRRLDAEHRIIDVAFDFNFLPRVNVMFCSPPSDVTDSDIITSPAIVDTASGTTWVNGPNLRNHKAGYVEADAPVVPGRHGNLNYADGTSVHINMHCGILTLVSKPILADSYRFVVLKDFHYGVVDYTDRPLIDDRHIGILGAAPSSFVPPTGLNYDGNKTLIQAMYADSGELIEEPSVVISLGKGRVDGWMWCGPGSHPSLKDKPMTGLFRSAVKKDGRPDMFWTVPLTRIELVSSGGHSNVLIEIPYTVRLDLGSTLNSFQEITMQQISTHLKLVRTVAQSGSPIRPTLSEKQDYASVILHLEDSELQWCIAVPFHAFFGFHNKVDDEVYDGMPLTFDDQTFFREQDQTPFGVLGAPFFSLMAIELRSVQGRNAMEG